MKVYGVKYTHDAGIACIKDGNLEYLIEAEKINGNRRYAKFYDTVDPIAAAKDFEDDTVFFTDVTVDGWVDIEETRSVIGDIAPYSDIDGDSNFTKVYGKTYKSTQHITNHIMAAYAMSNINRSCYVLVWDGGYDPTIFLVNYLAKKPIMKICTIMFMKARIFNMIGHYFGPYKTEDTPLDEEQHLILQSRKDLAGKLMSYAGLGGLRGRLIPEIYRIIDNWLLEESVRSDLFNQSDLGFSQNALLQRIKNAGVKYSDADIVRSLHQVIIDKMISRLEAVIPKGSNFIFTGGAALNIKLNSMIQKSGHFGSIFIPPTCNDSGNAIGAACVGNRITDINWSVYSGPKIIDTDRTDGMPMNGHELGMYLGAHQDRAVVVLNDRAEIGPRALGHRSIFMAPFSRENKEFLNKAKKRESFRPIAPIALAVDAMEHFDMVTDDPYMLYDHNIKTPTALHAITHADMTARVQTVSRSLPHSPFVLSVLEGFKSVTGVGILCNTSANKNGYGFFSSADDAIEWAKENGINDVWCNNFLYKV